jgi:pimeloyl-ACP methyl ester carboxylesterase
VLAGRARYVAIAAALVYAGFVGVVAFGQRSLLYFPTRDEAPHGRLAPWNVDGEVWGACREVAQPSAVWLMTHGNAGQAAQRGYVLDVLPGDAAVYVLEYPGYGMRSGEPTRTTIDAAARSAYRRLRELHPDLPVCVLGESIGSGPAAQLAREEPAPDAIVLATPYDALADVAAGAFPWLPVRWILQDDWDNGAALADYGGTLVILAAEYDDVIPIEHARALAAQVPRAELRVLPCGHNDWSAHLVTPLSAH